MGSTLIYLPDGQSVFAPQDPHGWSEGERVTGAKLTHDVGQAGLFYAARPMFQGLATTATVMATGRTSIGLQTELMDNYGGHSTTTNNSQYAFPGTRNASYPADDYYLCIGYIPFSTTDAANPYVVQIITSNGGTSGMTAPSGPGHNVACMAVDVFAATGATSGGPYAQLDGYNYSVSNVNTVVGGKCASLTVRWIGCNRTWNTSTPTPTLHTWTPQDEATADATGASSVSGGVKVPLNREITPNLRFYNSPPICRLTAGSTTQTIPSGMTWTAIQFKAMSIDNFGGWSSGSNTRYTAQRAGLYFVAGFAAWDESTGTHSGHRACRLQVNGDATKIYGGTTMLPTTGATADTLGLHAVALIQMNVGDYVELQMQQTQTNAPTALAVDSDTVLGARLVAVWQCL